MVHAKLSSSLWSIRIHAAVRVVAAARAMLRPAGVMLLAAGSLIWLWGAVAAADTVQEAGRSPERVIEDLHEGIIELAANYRDRSLEQRYEALLPLIESTHDLDFIAEFTIRRQWGDLNEAEQSLFLQAFERLSVMTYATRFAAVTEETFAGVTRMDSSAGRAQVHSAIRRDDADDIPLEYVLQETEQGWRIINIVADGVSDLALKRAEYQRVIASDGIAGLVRHLEAQTQRLAAEGEAPAP